MTTNKQVNALIKVEQPEEGYIDIILHDPVAGVPLGMITISATSLLDRARGDYSTNEISVRAYGWRSSEEVAQNPVGEIRTTIPQLSQSWEQYWLTDDTPKQETDMTDTKTPGGSIFPYGKISLRNDLGSCLEDSCEMSLDSYEALCSYEEISDLSHTRLCDSRIRIKTAHNTALEMLLDRSRLLENLSESVGEMIESGRLTEADIPDDFDALVRALSLSRQSLTQLRATESLLNDLHDQHSEIGANSLED